MTSNLGTGALGRREMGFTLGRRTESRGERQALAGTFGTGDTARVHHTGDGYVSANWVDCPHPVKPAAGRHRLSVVIPPGSAMS